MNCPNCSQKLFGTPRKCFSCGFELRPAEPKDRCAACHHAIEEGSDVWQAAIVTGVIGWDKGEQRQTVLFHESCYDLGGGRLLDALQEYRDKADLEGYGPGKAWIEWDRRDNRGITTSSQLESFDKRLSKTTTAFAMKDAVKQAKWQAIGIAILLIGGLIFSIVRLF